MAPEIDDTLLTAYALDELSMPERARVEAHLSADADARRFVEGVRATARLLSVELGREFHRGLTPLQHVVIERQLRQPRRRPGGRLVRTPPEPFRWGVLSFSLAASILIVAGSAALMLPWLHRGGSPPGGTGAVAERPEGTGSGDGRFPVVVVPNPGRGVEAPGTGGPPRRGGPGSEGEAIASVPDEWSFEPPMPGEWGAIEPRTREMVPGTGAGKGSGGKRAPFGTPGGAQANANQQPGQAVPQQPLRGAREVANGLTGGPETPGEPNDPARPAPALPPHAVRPERDGGGRSPSDGFNTEAYGRVVENAFLRAAESPLSTFSVDVDTASYSNVRRFLTRETLPPPDAVRIEELVNYFPYDYAPPQAGGDGGGPGKDAPFSVHVEVAQCPWDKAHRLARVALKGREVAADERPASNLVFLIDVSGSMAPDNKLPLVKDALRMLVEKLGAEDRVSMVVYAGTGGLVLPPTLGREKETLLAALDRLESGGPTNGAQGIELAYNTAVGSFIEGGINRVILCTDGDFNVGVTDQGSLTRLVEEKAKFGVFLSVLGFGMGNLKDDTMEKLADKGNGNYAYVDTRNEAKKVLVEQMSGTLLTVAKDVKIQVEFNPAVAGAYRLVGYENRALAKEDFNDDRKDAGEIGAGHSVTALYEIIPAASAEELAAPVVDELKYQRPAAVPTGSDELLTVKLRYKAPDGGRSRLIQVPVKDDSKTFAQASGDYKFAASVAAFGMLLRDSQYKGSANFDTVLELAAEGKGADPSGYRAEFIELVKRAKALKK